MDLSKLISLPRHQGSKKAEKTLSILSFFLTRIGFALLGVLVSWWLTGSVFAKDTITPPAPVIEEPASPADQEKPSQGEGEKAPATAKPTAVPKFSLPDVVITGENQLTIGAKRAGQKENDITLGAQNLSTLDRSSDDLPGLDKTITALSTQDLGPERDHALILHGGGGIPGTYGGWGLFAHDLTNMLYTLSGYYSTWAGQATAGGFDGDRRYRFGGDVTIKPDSKLDLRLAAYYGQNDAELPYKSSIRELHQGLDLKGRGDWQIADRWRGQFRGTFFSTTVSGNNAQELEGAFNVNAEGLDPVLESFALEVGGRITNSNFAPVPSTNNWGWVSLACDADITNNILVTGKIEAQVWENPSAVSKLFPSLDITWRPLTNTQLSAGWHTGRKTETFHQTFMNTEHIDVLTGFPSAVETTDEWEGKITQRITPTLVLSAFGSTSQLIGYQQWTDITPLTPAYIYVYSTVPGARMDHLDATAEWTFIKDFKLSGNYLWTQASDQSGLGLNFTQLPANQGTISLGYGDDVFEGRLSCVIASDRQGSATTSVVLPAFATFNLGGIYHFDRTLSVWVAGDNLLGQAYEIQPGYLEPQYHIRGGLEVIF